MTSAVVAIDVGGTSLKAGILGPDGIPALRRVPSERERGAEAVIDTIVDTATTLIDECSEHDLGVAGVGVAVPGIVDDAAGLGVFSVTMGWRDLPVEARLNERLGHPVTVGHDVRTGAIAEATFGSAAGSRSALFLPIGTGLSAAMIVDGVVVPGATFRAGEVGQIEVAAPGGGTVTLEGIASARAIAERYAASAEVSDEGVDAKRVAELVRQGDHNAVSVWHEAIDRLADVVAVVIAAVDFEVLVVGGGLGRAGETLTEPLRAALSLRLPWRETPQIVLAHFADDAGFVGAGIAAWKAAGRDVGELESALRSERWRPAEAVVRP